MNDLEDVCPICIEPFDDTDLAFVPCSCNYRVCMFCVRRMTTEFDGRCPGCRRQYVEENYRFEKIDPSDLERRKQKRAEKLKKYKEITQLLRSSSASSINSTNSNLKQQLNQLQNQSQTLNPLSSRGRQTSQPTTSTTSPIAQGNSQKPKLAHQHSAPSLNTTANANTNTKNIGATSNSNQPITNVIKSRLPYVNIRATNPDLVDLTGLAPNIAKEATLRKNEYFGQYGEIIAISIQPPSVQGSKDGASALILFSNSDEALQAVQTVDGFILDGYKISAKLAKSRYCKSYLAGQSCRDNKCMELHRIIVNDVDNDNQSK